MQIADDVKPARIDESSSLGVNLLSLLHCVQKHFACDDDDDDDDNNDNYDDDEDDDDASIFFRCFPVSKTLSMVITHQHVAAECQ